MEHHRATGLCSNCDCDANQIRWEGRPDVRFDFRNGAIQIWHNPQLLIGWDDQIIPIHLPTHSHPFKDMRNHMKVIYPSVFHAYISMCDSRRTDKTYYLQIIGTNRELATMQFGHTMDMKRIGADLFDLRPKPI